MADKLRPLNDRQKEYAKALFPAEALYYSRRGNHCEFHCMHCGAIVPELGKWPFDECQKDTWICPECGAECKVCPQYSGGFGHNRDRKTGAFSVSPTDTIYIEMLDTHESFQVLRMFEVYRMNCRTIRNGVVCGVPTEFCFHELYQNWIAADGTETIASRSYKRSFNFHRWDYHSQWGINRHNEHCSGYYMMRDVYDNHGVEVFPEPRILPVLRRNGLNANVIRRIGSHVDIGTLSMKLLTDNVYEELVKTGQLGVVSFFLGNSHGRKPDDYLRQVRVCTRHGYSIKDAGMWLDYIDDLEYIGLDTRNPRYICPKNLAKAHAEMQRRRDRLEKKREAERDIEIAKKYEAAYAKQKAHLLGIAFGDETISISVIQTVEEIRLEGVAMHHCVFKNGYYKQKDCVILSARDSQGNRLETIEIGLKPLSVLQSRGMQNLPTKEHEHIVALCKAHLGDFRRAAKRV